ncbi:unnamed protein product [Discula destructiva]
MCRPLEAKGLSLATGNYYAVTSLEPDGLVPGDEPAVDGMILQGYNHGLPVYYKFTGIHADLSTILTETAYGKRFVRQPVQSCFGCSPADVNAVQDADLSLGSLFLKPNTITNRFPGTETFNTQVPPNRAFSNEWFKIDKSPLGGYGIFALKDIAAYSHILLERPFLRVRSCDDLQTKYEKLGWEEKLVYDGLHGFSEREDNELNKRFNANSFFIPGGAGILAIATNFNHACYLKRNVQYYWDNFRKFMVFTADTDVAEGQELLISYGNVRWRLKQKFGFLCQCGGCEGADEDPASAYRQVQW